jgi:hypothetical protein
MWEWFLSRSVKSVFRPSSFSRPRVFLASRARVVGPRRSPSRTCRAIGPLLRTSPPDRLPRPPLGASHQVRVLSLSTPSAFLLVRVPPSLPPDLHLVTSADITLVPDLQTADRLVPLRTCRFPFSSQSVYASGPPAHPTSSSVSFRLPWSGFTLSDPASPDPDSRLSSDLHPVGIRLQSRGFPPSPSRESNFLFSASRPAALRFPTLSSPLQFPRARVSASDFLLTSAVHGCHLARMLQRQAPSVLACLTTTTARARTSLLS